MTTPNPSAVGGDTILPPKPERASLRDLDIRCALREHLQKLHADDPQTRVIEEMELCLNEARVDLAVVNGRLEGFEIKSDRDTLGRLARQSAVYNRVFDRVTVVAGTRHVARLERSIPHWWGICEAAQLSSGVALRVVREAAPNPSPSAFAVTQLLRRAEALQILEATGVAAGKRSKPLATLREALVNELSFEELGLHVRAALVARADSPAPSPWSSGDGSSRRSARLSGSRSALPPHKRR